MEGKPVTTKRPDWIKALRSGEFHQTNGRLKKNDARSDGQPAYCCLGVAACVLGLKWHPDNYGDYVTDERGEMYEASLPPEVLEDVGLDGFKESVLVSLNDQHSFSFTMIADILEHDLFTAWPLFSGVSVRPTIQAYENWKEANSEQVKA
jgi:hypothetical protein